MSDDYSDPLLEDWQVTPQDMQAITKLRESQRDLIRAEWKKFTERAEREWQQDRKYSAWRLF